MLRLPAACLLTPQTRYGEALAEEKTRVQLDASWYYWQNLGQLSHSMLRLF